MYSAPNHPPFCIVELIVTDFDGVMTDNRVYVFDDGREAVACNRADGLGCELLRAAGIEILILSTETNPVVAARARKIGVAVEQGVRDKGAALSALIAARGLDPARVMYVGNDVNDLAAMKLIGWPAAPADAHESVRALARIVTRARGGEGVVREIADRLEARTWRP
jgi:3-deoxy-D-manno-octulosonate 8-phosphate phosphatase (KDO 8-P phosphatase)